VSIEARCDGAKKTMTSGTVETLYVNGTDLPSVQATIAAKLQQDSASITSSPRAPPPRWPASSP
jgi:simple sugar transport system substrate-binding protein